MAKNIQMGSLWDAEELSRVMPNTFWSQSKDKPVTVLGRTFKNDEERREVFRKELREKLPELKKIEGFPIGEDDDIINLSDPPYYTACPNPWLNDFIKEWEEEKKELVVQGKRVEDFEVKEPYAYGIQQGKNSTIYNAHTYHTKVPHEVIMRYILHYTQPGDIVLDSFAGTGMTGVAATACEHPTGETKTEIEGDFKDNGYVKPNWGKRHSVCGDLSPLCFHISSNYNSTVDSKRLKVIVDEIIDKLLDRFGFLYEFPVKIGDHVIKYHINYFVWSEVVSCYNCGKELNVHDLSYDYATHKLYEQLKCPYCGTEQKRVDADSIFETTYDQQMGQAISQLKYVCCLLNYTIPKKGRFLSSKIPDAELPPFEGSIPLYEFGEGDKFGDPKRTGAKSVNLLYHERTKYVLAYLYKIIHEDYKYAVKPLMFIFTSMLPKLSRMNRYMPQHGSRALVGPMANTLYIPPQGVENNPIDQFEYQAKKVLKAFSECKLGSTIQICSATHSSLPNESIDYIFTDPPFGANIMYSELNTVSESWLHVLTNNKEEAISNRTQHKGLPEYQDIMTQCFKEYNRVLKPGKWMTVEFSNTSAAFWNSLQYAIKNAGFIISSITDLNKERGGLHAMLGPTAVKQDLAISCYKPSAEIAQKMKEQAYESIWDFVDSHLEHLPVFVIKNGSSVFISERDGRIIYDRVIAYYVQNGLTIPMDAAEFQNILKHNYAEKDGMFFTHIQLAEYEAKKAKHPDEVPMGLIISDESDGIAWLKNLLRQGSLEYSQIQPQWMKAIDAIRKEEKLPELRDILEENFIFENGKWRLADEKNAVDKEKFRLKRLYKEFDAYVEIANQPRTKQIKAVRTEALREGFKRCYKNKEYLTIIKVGDKIPQNLLEEDEVLLQYYGIACQRV